MNNKEEEPKYMKSTYKPGWLGQIDLHLNHIRGRMGDLIDVTEAYDEILTKPEMALITPFTEEVEKLCAKLIKEVYELNPHWEIFLNPERKWWLKKVGIDSSE